MKIIIETESLDELRQIAKELSGVVSEKPKKAKKEPKAEETTPEPVVVPAPEPEPVPEPAKEPLVPTTPGAGAPAERVYQMDELARAGAALMQQDRSNSAKLAAILRTFGVNTLPDLPKEKYPEFADELRKLGATV